MTHSIHCFECGEEINPADFRATQGRCPYCGASVDWPINRFETGLEALRRVRIRLELQEYLRAGSLAA